MIDTEDRAFLEELAHLCWRHKKAFAVGFLCDLPGDARQLILGEDGRLLFVRDNNPQERDPYEYWESCEGLLVVHFPQTAHEKLEWAAREQEMEVGA